MAPRLKLKCPDCSTLLDVTGIDPGRTVLCPKCERLMKVPDPATARRVTRTIAKQAKPPAAKPPQPPPTKPAMSDIEDIWDDDDYDSDNELAGTGGNPVLETLSLGESKGDDKMAEFKDDDGWIDWNKKRKRQSSGSLKSVRDEDLDDSDDSDVE